MQFKISASPHTGITVANLDRSIAFFRDVLGFEAGEKIHHDINASARITGVPGADVVVCFLQTPNHTIELLEFLAPTDRKVSDLRSCDPGAMHLAVVADNIEVAVNAALDAGFTMDGEIFVVPTGPRKGGKTVYLRSPDGYYIEFQQNPAA